MRSVTISLLVLLMLSGCQGKSNLKLPSLISDNMVLQQKTNAKIWGKASPGHRISVSASWNAKAKTKAGDDGKWSVSLPTPVAGGPYTVTVACNDTTRLISNVLVGEVWFCSGQSNMEMPVEGWPPNDTIMHSAATLSSAAIPEIRLFNVQKKISGVPLDDCTGKWEVSSPETARSFSATAYFFGKKLHNDLKIPVGLIESAWGGTPSESWTSSEALEKSGEFVKILSAMKESVPIQSGYHAWLDSLKQIEISSSAKDQWKNLVFNDETIPASEFDDSSWPEMKLPVQFETNIGEFDGAVWFRKKVELKPEMTGKELTLSLGPVDDMDRAYFNGTLIGATEESGKWNVDRNYTVPANLVKNGINIISVRVLDTQGGGGVCGTPDKMYLSLKTNNKVKVQIDGVWKFQPVAELNGNKLYIFDLPKNGFFSRKRPVALGAGTPSVLYNGMVAPVLPYQIKGAIWYQGEANVGRAEQYSKIFPAMITNWREAWGIPDFPFYFVQIAPYIYSHLDSLESGYLREAQKSALKLNNTGMVATFDIATVKNIHPPFKKEVGDRLAMLALNDNYGMKNQSIGPVFKSSVIDGTKVRLKFDNAGNGLVAKDNLLKDFEIAGSNGKYVKAKAEIVNDEIVVSSPLVAQPVSVRFCWRNGAEASLFNKEGFPAWQFITK